MRRLTWSMWIAVAACGPAPRDRVVSASATPAPPPAHLARPILCEAIAATLGKQLAGTKPLERNAVNPAPANPDAAGTTRTACGFTTSGGPGATDAQRVYVAITCRGVDEPCTPTWQQGFVDYNREVLHRDGQVADVPGVGKRACRTSYRGAPPDARTVDEVHVVHRTLACTIAVRATGLDPLPLATALDAAL